MKRGLAAVPIDAAARDGAGNETDERTRPVSAIGDPGEDMGRQPAKGRTAKAVLWMLVDVGGSQGLSFVIYAVLTRILGPEAFGVFSLSLAITAVANVVLLQGFSDALIQRATVSDDDLNTAFWTNLGMGVALTGALCLAAPWMAAAFGAPELSDVIRGMAVLCVFRALVSVHSALCRRELKMSLFAARAIAGYVLGGVAGIALAMNGWGVWALVAFQLAQALVILVVMWMTIDWRPRLRFSTASLRDMTRFTRHFIPASILSSITDKVDNFIIGLFLDVTAVGYYSLALKMVQAISLLSVAPLQVVMMPVLARLAGQPREFGETYTRLVTASAAAWMPTIVGLGVLAPIFLPLAFGVQWNDAVPVLQAMCLAGVTLPLWFSTGQALAALGRPDLYVLIAMGQLVIGAIAFTLGTQFGIVAVGWAWAGVSILCVPLHLAVLHRSCAIAVTALLLNAVRISACGLAMVGVMLALRHFTGDSLEASGVQLMLGVIVYLALLEWMLLPGYVSSLIKQAVGLMPMRAVR